MGEQVIEPRGEAANDELEVTKVIEGLLIGLIYLVESIRTDAGERLEKRWDVASDGETVRRGHFESSA